MENILWTDLLKIPHPQWMISIFWRTMLLFWRQELNPDLEFSERLPQMMKDVHLSIDPKGFSSRRYHIYTLSESEQIGIWDESPFNLSFPKESISSQPFLEHGYHHSFLNLLKDVENNIKPVLDIDPQYIILLQIIQKAKQRFSISCSNCKEFLMWCHHFLENEYTKHKISVAPSVLVFLLHHKNTRKKIINTNKQQCYTVLEKALHAFLVSFFPIQEQTIMNPMLLLQGLIQILENHHCTLENLKDTEENCAKDMKSYLFKTLKFLKTKSLQINHFPRFLLVARESFKALLESIPSVEKSTSSIGHLMLLSFLFFEDRSINSPPTEKDRVLFYNEKGNLVEERYFTEEECSKFIDYHPLLRPSVFQNI